MKDKCFLDTNLIVYLFDKSEPDKRQKARRVFIELQRQSESYISSQVVNEFIVSSSQKIKKPIPFDQIEKKLLFLDRRLHIVPLRFETSLKAVEIRRQYHYAYWDALIIAAALEAQCATLYSEDMQHGQQIEKRLTILNPFI
jgi:predicted nucleic acid-binding protein